MEGDAPTGCHEYTSGCLLSLKVFYTTANVQAMTTDNELRAVKCKAVLVDRGSEGNLVARYVINALKARIVPVDIRCKVATGHALAMFGCQAQNIATITQTA